MKKDLDHTHTSSNLETRNT